MQIVQDEIIEERLLLHVVDILNVLNSLLLNNALSFAINRNKLSMEVITLILETGKSINLHGGEDWTRNDTPDCSVIFVRTQESVEVSLYMLFIYNTNLNKNS